MSTQLFANNAKTSLALAINDVETTLSVVSVASFPEPSGGDFALATLSNADESLFEIVRIIGVDTIANTFTVVRWQENYTAKSWPIETNISMRITHGTLLSFTQGVPAGSAIGYLSIALGGIKNRIRKAIMMDRFPVVKMGDRDPTGPELNSNAPEAVLCSPYFDLAIPATWAMNTVYHHGDVIQPTTPDGYQYLLWTNDDPVTPTAKLVSDTTGTSEPAWVANVGGYNNAPGGGRWICQKPSLGYAMQSPPSGTIFVPTQFGFVTHAAVGTLTSSPVVSVGVIGDATRYVSAQAATISSSFGFHLFTGPPQVAVLDSDQLLFTLSAAATGGRCVGRFFVRGFFVELPDHL